MPSTRILALLTVVVMAIATARGLSQAPTPPPPPQAPSQASPASKPPPKTATPQSYPAEQVKAGQPLFAAQCGFCHGRDAEGGESGPDLTRSTIVASDVRGDTIGPVVRNGRSGGDPTGLVREAAGTRPANDSHAGPGFGVN